MLKEIRELLSPHMEPEYAAFEAKLTPGLPDEYFIGVRVPELRRAAKIVQKSPFLDAFLEELPHDTYDENILHAVLISDMKPYERCLAETERFLPYVNNWAVCDTMRPKVFGKNRDTLLPVIRSWVASGETYTVRFGIDMLMTYYLGEYFSPEYPELVAEAANRSDEYYVKMMAAWYFATALYKNRDGVIGYITENRLPVWTHNKTIQKAKESFRITDEEKAYLNSLRR